MLLVVIVRTLLHPVTKWTQIRMQRFGKQMQSIAPKMQQLKEKYADDQVKLQAETGKLWKEEGISPAGMLGCLTTFIQTPVWLALSAMLFFAIEIRHQHGFYGVFQTMGGPSSAFPYWFLGDLAEPDRLVKFSGPIHIPLLSGMMGSIASFNVLPIFMGVLFYVQQKYISPPQTSATMTPEQEMQMKLMKWMTVFMFPLMMYNAPSGLTLYFFTNSLLGILEGKWIKRHIEKHDLLNMDKLRAGKKPASGWMAKLQERAEKARQMQEEMQRQQQKRGGKDAPNRFGRKR
jgi:YidC/Oxa1 family membrane protein insertase